MLKGTAPTQLPQRLRCSGTQFSTTSHNISFLFGISISYPSFTLVQEIRQTEQSLQLWRGLQASPGGPCGSGPLPVAARGLRRPPRDPHHDGHHPDDRRRVRGDLPSPGLVPGAQAVRAGQGPHASAVSKPRSAIRF